MTFVAVGSTTVPAPAERLTRRQLETLIAIALHMHETGRAPTYREIGAALGGITTNATFCLLRALEREHMIATGHGEHKKYLRITAYGCARLGISCSYCEKVGHGS